MVDERTEFLDGFRIVEDGGSVFDPDAQTVLTDECRGIGIVGLHGWSEHRVQWVSLTVLSPFAGPAFGCLVSLECADEAVDALGEFADCFAGEGQREDTVLGNVAVSHQPQHTLRNDSGLAGTSACDHDSRFVDRAFDDLLLFVSRHGLGAVFERCADDLGEVFR